MTTFPIGDFLIGEDGFVASPFDSRNPLVLEIPPPEPGDTSPVVLFVDCYKDSDIDLKFTDEIIPGSTNEPRSVEASFSGTFGYRDSGGEALLQRDIQALLVQLSRSRAFNWDSIGMESPNWQFIVVCPLSTTSGFGVSRGFGTIGFVWDFVISPGSEGGQLRFPLGVIVTGLTMTAVSHSRTIRIETVSPEGLISPTLDFAVFDPESIGSVIDRPVQDLSGRGTNRRILFGSDTMLATGTAISGVRVDPVFSFVPNRNLDFVIEARDSEGAITDRAPQAIESSFGELFLKGYRPQLFTAGRGQRFIGRFAAILSELIP